MPGHSLSLRFHGIGVEIESENAAVLAELGRDFKFFLADARTAASISLRLTCGKPQALPRSCFLKWNDCRFGEIMGVRRSFYSGDASVYWDEAKGSGEVCSENPELLRELAYLTLHSKLGEKLDQRGLHRVHALGFSVQGGAALLFLPEGGGKTTLAYELLRGFPEVKILGDDIPLLSSSGDRVFPFPQRLGFRGSAPDEIPQAFLSEFKRRRHGVKIQADFDFYRDRVAEATPLRWVITASKGAVGAPFLKEGSRFKAAAALAAGLVMGIGTPQILELALPLSVDAAHGFGEILALRLSAARRALSFAQVLHLEMSEDPRADAALLAALKS